jgi:hypothetical protein
LLNRRHREKETHVVVSLKMRHQSIADAITRYVERHPSAADTDVGIAEWWLLGLERRIPLEDVRAALTALEVRGVMEQVILHDGRRLWRPTRRSQGA